MKTEYSKHYFKDIKSLDKKTLQKIIAVVDEVKFAKSISNIGNIKKMRGKNNYFRIRIGNYRIGIEVIKDTIVFHRVLQRKEIYRYFP